MQEEYFKFQFDPATLVTPRKPGISAYMRIKNEEQFLRLAIESHLPFYDEIVAVYNGCTDHTEEILCDLQKQYPDKIRVFHYLPKIHPVATEAHKNTPTESVHSMANYYNYALSKCSYSVATKLDVDHLAIPQNLKLVIKTIRVDIKNGIQKIYEFSGINLLQICGRVLCGGMVQYPFGGNGDHWYHPVEPRIQFRQESKFEVLKFPHELNSKREYMGIMYFHLHYLKKQVVAHDNLTGKIWFAIPFEQFDEPANFKRMLGLLEFKNRLRYTIYRFTGFRKLKYKLTKKHVRLGAIRMIRLKKDLASINYQRDCLDKLKGLW